MANGSPAWIPDLLKVLKDWGAIGAVVVFLFVYTQVPEGRADPYTGTMAREAWAIQQATNTHILESIQALAQNLKDHAGMPYHTTTGRDLAGIDARLADILRRLDGIERKLEGR